MIISIFIFIISLFTDISLVMAGKGLIRDTEYGKVQGFVRDTPVGLDVEIYLGVRFAKAPVGDLRFEYPKKPEKWNNVQSATTLPPMCPQHNGYVPIYRQGFTNMSEDCLFLNIYSPRVDKSNKLLEVFLFIHGGSNVAGMGSMLDGHVLAAFGRMLVVDFNYRLGLLGFLGFNDKRFNGNFGMYDQVMALTWVKNNIKNFGGDPQKITIVGHSAGGADVGYHLISPLSKGLFRSAISMSGPLISKLSWRTKTELGSFLTVIADAARCSRSDRKLKACLTKISLKDLIKIQHETESQLYGYCPVTAGGPFLPFDPEYLIKSQPLNANSFMLGLVRDERGTFYTRQYYAKNELKHYLEVYYKNTHIYDVIKFEYSFYHDRRTHKVEKTFSNPTKALGDLTLDVPTLRMAKLLKEAKNESKVYMYQFDYASNTSLMPQWGAYHGEDLLYIFGYPLIGYRIRNTKKQIYNEVDKQMSRLYMNAFVNFVKNGDPLHNMTYELRDYELNEGRYIRFHSDRNRATFDISYHLKSRKYYFWTELLPFLLNARENLYESIQTYFLGFKICLSLLIILAVVCLVLLVLFLCCIKTRYMCVKRKQNMELVMNEAHS